MANAIANSIEITTASRTNIRIRQLFSNKIITHRELISAYGNFFSQEIHVSNIAISASEQNRTNYIKSFYLKNNFI